MYVPPLGEKHYVRTLRSSNMPYHIRQRQPKNYNNTGQKPDIPPWPSSLETNHTVTTTDITAKLQGNKDMSMCTTFRQIPSPTPTLWHGRLHSSPRYIGQEKSNDSLFRHINSIKTEETQKQLSDPNHQL